MVIRHQFRVCGNASARPGTFRGAQMEQVHAGMNITESEFNHGVDLFINAMTKADIPHSLQNKILAVIIHTRDQMIYI